MDEFSTILRKLYSIDRNHPENVEDIRNFAKELGFCSKAIPVVHVTGSNGKGSVCFKIASALQTSGYKVGLYTSPHIHCFTERISLSGSQIEKKQVVEGLRYILQEAERRAVTFSPFTFTTLLALWYFHKKKPDLAVVEVGIGGRLDATRIFSPILSIITSVSLEHTALLGSTREEIAKEKAGICVPGVPLLLGCQAWVETALAYAREMGSQVLQAERPFGASFDEENSCIAKAACSYLQKYFPKLTIEYIAAGCCLRPSCRKEKIGSFIFDVAHNPAAIARLFEDVQRDFPGRILQAVIGMSSDKDIQKCLNTVASHATRIWLVQAEGPRSAPVAAMLAILHDQGYPRASASHSIDDAIHCAAMQKDAITVVCGSFYIMDLAKKAANSIT